MNRNIRWAVLSVLVVLALLVTACGATATPTAAPTVAPTVAPTKAPTTAAPTVAPTAAPPTATKVPPTATPIPPTATPLGPQVGGTFVAALMGDLDTLDPQKTSITTFGFGWMGACLVGTDPKTMKQTPWLAQSWKFSADGKTWDFVLRKDVKFHDGTLLKAQDFAWTFMRAIDPATKAGAAGSMLAGMLKAEAVDDYTLRLTLGATNFYLLQNLASPYLQPLSKAAVEKAGAGFGVSAFVGVGPYKFKQWLKGDKLVMDRNPDYVWWPTYDSSGPFVQTVEIRMLPEYSTIAAGLESGDLDYYDLVDAKDVQRLKDSGKVAVFEALTPGAYPYVQYNCGKPPFDDINMRKAFSYATDRATILKVTALGQGKVMNGTLSPAQIGYWPGMENVGYAFDLAKAKEAFKTAGYTAGADGMLAKDGQALKVTIITHPQELAVRIAQVLQEQYKTAGVVVDIQQVDLGTLMSKTMGGDFQLSLFGYTHASAAILLDFFAGEKAGGLNLSKVNDPKLDELLLAMRTTLEPDKQQQAVEAAATYLAQQAYMNPMFTLTSFFALNKRIGGAVQRLNGSFNFDQIYIKK